MPFTPEQAREFYDRFGSRQDRQSFYEEPAIRDLVAHGHFEEARAVVEFGCGTGRFARQLLEKELPPGSRYLGIDVSRTMVELARGLLSGFSDRARIRLSNGSPRVEDASGSFDRFVSNYVLDLLPEQTIRAVVGEAGRILRPEGRLCLISLTDGSHLSSRLISAAWEWISDHRPAWVGGCRPLDLPDYLPSARWQIQHQRCITRWGIASQVVVASRR